MQFCPTCESPLERCQYERVRYWHCAVCVGGYLALAVLKNRDGRLATRLTLRGRRSPLVSKRNCSCCHRPMLRVHDDELNTQFEFCKTCAWVWFPLDLHEYLSRPRMLAYEPEPFELPAEAVQIERQWQRVRGAQLARRVAQESRPQPGILEETVTPAKEALHFSLMWLAILGFSLLLLTVGFF